MLLARMGMGPRNAKEARRTLRSKRIPPEEGATEAGAKRIGEMLWSEIEDLSVAMDNPGCLVGKAVREKRAVRADSGCEARITSYNVCYTKLLRFRVPTLLEQSDPFIGNPGLSPEVSVSWEAGVDASLLDGRSTISATWFYQDFRDLIQFDESVAGPAGFGQLRNVGSAFSRGVEAEVEAEITRASYNFV